ncbi:MAG: hypothetical protein K0R36_3059 [Chryseobacterium sp.]|jgi:ABC-type Fe3+ transport system permease subunit|uniref:hypothetical protein n=1 Tax=Chryseobacterium sp. TaxID=1871047 RepID=UPI00262937BD|nr:hypothetical protein [Chryseobacterium sp.]MDF2551780.1 hypothetical protein [Chryseobacterium sp.]MDF2933728.1 hypothetical protein [Chryseobacterium sp.]
MKILTLLEVGGLEGLVAMIILIIVVVASVVSLVITVFVKLIYESKDGRKFSKKQFWQTMLISLLICGLISGFVCGGM